MNREPRAFPTDADRERIYQTAVQQLKADDRIAIHANIWNGVPPEPDIFQRGIKTGLWNADGSLILPMPSSWTRRVVSV